MVHTLASAGHVLDAVELMECDQRLQVVFAQAPDLFSNGVQEYLRGLGAVVIPWDQATETDFDLIVAADCAGVHKLHGPVVALAHGVMNNKLAPAALGGPASGLVVGLGSPWLTWYGRLVPAMVAVSHRDVIPVLARQCPQAVPVATVVGDLCLDRLAATASRRRAYRRSLDVPDGRTLVAVSSTWGPESLLGRSWRTLFDLLDGLPQENYEVRLVMHPGVWCHGRRQILSWLRQQLRSGLRVVEPMTWRGLVAAADVLIGDHGSVTTYAAAAGVPVLRASSPPGCTAPGSATELLAGTTPALTAHQPLPAQLDAAGRARREASHLPIAAAVTSEPGRAAPLLRTHLYRLLAMSVPSGGDEAMPVDPPTLIDH
ncbi:hypothetical protein [Micromonospora sp. WMMD1082]|uniref:hypothetical protein n=1 Tax=Micromonospora sp. WMMD1082 TaxID=3016104 RepID=UPI002415BC0C|nr:hypothetical protein [Micromonospora sp. WMMD1082]MDG4796289.1 hypothetical protein [Micromonospora sp. WMMD1082]